MAFNPKTWRNLPDTSTPFSASGLSDLENRIYNGFESSDILKRKPTLDYTTNFNNITDTGYYDYNGYAGENTGSNRPYDTKSQGFLIVMFGAGYNTIMQIFFPSSGTLAIKRRMFYDGSWHDWV